MFAPMKDAGRGFLGRGRTVEVRRHDDQPAIEMRQTNDGQKRFFR